MWAKIKKQKSFPLKNDVNFSLLLISFRPRINDGISVQGNVLLDHSKNECSQLPAVEAAKV